MYTGYLWGFHMVEEVKNNAYVSISNTVENAEIEKNVKEAQYREAMKNYDIFYSLRNQMLKEFNYAENLYKQGRGGSEYAMTKAKLNSVLSLYNDAEIKLDVSRGSYLSSIFYYGDLKQTQILAS
jgi:hypothetical protein